MAENDAQHIPKFDSLESLITFFDENDMGDYLENMPEVDFDVDLSRRKHYVAVDVEIADRLSEISKQQHVSSGAIVNSWLREKISDYSRQQ